jgi:hypothetical protein
MGKPNRHVLTDGEEAVDEVDGLQGTAASAEKPFERGKVKHVNMLETHTPISRRRGSREERENLVEVADLADPENEVSATHNVRNAQISWPDIWGGYDCSFEERK